MSERIKVGMIGAGGWGENVISAYQQSPYAQIVAIADISLERAKAVAEKFGIPAVYADYREMLEKEQLDMASVATPDNLHREPVCYCFEKGLHVFLEKPVATTMEDCGAITQAAQKAGKKFMTDYFMRFIPQFWDAKEALTNGELGEIIQGYARIDGAISIPTKMLRWSQDSSPIFFLMIHNIDAVRWLMGKEVTEVYAKEQKIALVQKGVNTSDSVQALVTFEGGSTVLFDSNWILPRTFDGLNDQFVRIVGTKGMVYVDLTYQGLRMFKPEFKGDFEFSNRATVYVNPMFNGRITGCVERAVGHFIDCVRNDTEPAITLKDAVEPTRIACAVKQSMETGSPVKL